MFLQEPLLKAVQYLPDIVVLQRQLYDMCNHRLDLSDAETITMRKFLSTHISKGKIIRYKANKLYLCNCVFQNTNMINSEEWLEASVVHGTL